MLTSPSNASFLSASHHDAWRGHHISASQLGGQSFEPQRNLVFWNQATLSPSALPTLVPGLAVKGADRVK